MTVAAAPRPASARRSAKSAGLRELSERASLAAFSVPRVDSSFTREMALDEQRYGYTQVSAFLEDPHPSRILRDKSDRSLRLGELYDRMLESDLDLASFARKRKDAVLALPRRVVPEDGTPLAKETADFTIAALGLISGFDLNLDHQLDSVSKGLAIDELVWERIERGELAGAIVPTQIIDRPMWRFLFRQGQLYVRQASGAEPVKAPDGKFLVMRYGSKDSPWGKALLDECYWLWWLKKNGLKFYATFLDKWAQPLAKGKYKYSKDEKTNRANQDALLSVLQSIQTEYGIALPDGLDVELLEASRSGSASYEQFIGLLTRSEALAYLGEVDTSGQAKGPGSFAKSEVSDSVRKEKVVRDAHALAAHLRDNLLKPLIAINFGPDAPVPRLLIDTVEVEDRAQRLAGMDVAMKAKQPVPRRYFYLTTQVPEPEAGEAVVEMAPEPAPAPPVPMLPGSKPDTPPAPPTQAAPKEDDGETDEAPAAKASAPKFQFAAELPVPPAAPATPDTAAPDDLEALVIERDADLTEISTTLAPRTIDYYAGWKEHLLAAWDDGTIAAGNGLRSLVGAINPLDNARALQTAQTHGFGIALAHLQEDVNPAALMLEMPPGWQGATDPTSAIAYWANQLNVPQDVFLQLSDESRRGAFTVAGVTDMELLQAIHALLGQAMAEGWVRERFVQELDQLFVARGLDPLSNWHAELIYANATRTAASLMRYRQLILNPAARRLTPYLTWWSLDDGRVRPEHAAMHNYTAAIEHEIWKTWWPPAGHNCRCYIGTVNLAKARRMGLTGAEPMGPWPTFEGVQVMPDPGFQGVPSFAGVTQKMDGKARDLIDQARAEGNPDLLDAILQLFAQLFDIAADAITFADFVAPAELAAPAAEKVA